MGCGIMFPRDYILGGEGEGVGWSVGGFNLLCQPVETYLPAQVGVVHVRKGTPLVDHIPKRFCSSVPFHISASSSGEPDDWDGNQGRLAPTRGGTKNVPHLPDEEEDEDAVAQVEQGQERGKVTVRSFLKQCLQQVKLVSIRWRWRFQTGLIAVQVLDTVRPVAKMCQCFQNVIILNWAVLGLQNPKTSCYEPMCVQRLGVVIGHN